MNPEIARLGRLVRRLQVAVAILGAAVVGLIGYGVWLTAEVWDDEPALPNGASSTETGGVDIHAAFTPGSSARVKTEAGREVRVTVKEFTWRQGPVATLQVEGMRAEDTAGRWYFFLYDNTRLRLETEILDGSRVRVSLAGSLPSTGKVHFLQLDIDDSRGDLYFDVNQE
ncbi:MAG: hypothetical protein U0547_07530 [Dehalococcoidia bacterium]